MTSRWLPLLAAAGTWVAACAGGRATAPAAPGPLGAAAAPAATAGYESEATSSGAGTSAAREESGANAAGGDRFETTVRPLLESRCSPCHFAGGKMYERLPFDRPGTIRTLGTKLFTRIKDENEAALIRAFLEEQDPPPAGTPAS